MRSNTLQCPEQIEQQNVNEGSHVQAIRALGRHLCRVIFKMLTQERPYWIDP